MSAKYFSVRAKIINRIKQLLPGSILFAQDFYAEGSSEAVRQQLTRLVKAGLLKRLSQGVYIVPKKLGDHGYLLPTADEIASALARRDKARIIPTGEVALWKLGLSTQVPLNYVYLTDGPSRVIVIEEKDSKTSFAITFKHASPRNFALRGKISSQVIQALRAIGEKNLTEDVLDKIRSLIMRENLDDLNHDLTVAPVWISNLIKGFFNNYR
jgi:hypothetical protein